MKKYLYLLTGIILFFAVNSCKKDGLGSDYKDYFHGHEIVYTGAVNGVVVGSGNLEVALKWKASSDPTIVKYVIYYNNKADSQVVTYIAKTDTIRTVIKGLAEYNYSFTIYSYDASGNKSIPFEVDNAKVYGPIYISGLTNRGYDGTNPYVYNPDGTVQLNFLAANTSSTNNTINTKTVINYVNAAGMAATAVLLPAKSSVILPSYKSGTAVYYKSYYIPDHSALDTFSVTKPDTLPQIVNYVACDKSLFTAYPLFNDVTAAFGTNFNQLWDGTVGPQEYPNLFHSSQSALPFTLSFDLGKRYTHLAKFEETGRISGYNNPLDFEVWGIADATNADVTVPGTDPAWQDQMVAKGWVLLKDCVRTDDGVALMEFDLANNPPPVRYIRIRVKSTLSTQAYANISEITLYDKE
jgi:hypothetical protein